MAKRQIEESQEELDWNYWKEKQKVEDKQRLEGYPEKVMNGTVLNLQMLKEIRPEQTEFPSKTEFLAPGVPKMIKKSVYIYTIEGKEYRIPKSLHKEIMNMLEFSPPRPVKVVVTGSGMTTRYGIEKV